MQPQTVDSLNKRVRDLETEVRIQYEHFSDHPALQYSLLWLGNVGRLLQAGHIDLPAIRRDAAAMLRYIESQPDFAAMPVGAMLLAFARELSDLQELFYPATRQPLLRRPIALLWLPIVAATVWLLGNWLAPRAENPPVKSYLGNIVLVVFVLFWVFFAIRYWWDHRQ